MQVHPVQNPRVQDRYIIGITDELKCLKSLLVPTKIERILLVGLVYAHKPDVNVAVDAGWRTLLRCRVSTKAVFRKAAYGGGF